MPTPFQRAREEGVHGHKFARGAHLDVALAVLGVEALERLDLLLGQLDLPLPDRLLKPQERWATDSAILITCSKATRKVSIQF